MLMSKRPAGNWVSVGMTAMIDRTAASVVVRDAIVSDKKNLTGILMNVVQEHVH